MRNNVWLAEFRRVKGIPASIRGIVGATVPVQDGQFSAGPFSFNGQAFRAGPYILEISLTIDLQTATLEEIKQLGKPKAPIYAATIMVPPINNGPRPAMTNSKRERTSPNPTS